MHKIIGKVFVNALLNLINGLLLSRKEEKWLKWKLIIELESQIFFFDNHFCGVYRALGAVQLYKAHVLNLLGLFCKLTLKIK